MGCFQVMLPCRQDRHRNEQSYKQYDEQTLAAGQGQNIPVCKGQALSLRAALAHIPGDIDCCLVCLERWGIEGPGIP